MGLGLSLVYKMCLTYKYIDTITYTKNWQMSGIDTITILVFLIENVSYIFENLMQNPIQ